MNLLDQAEQLIQPRLSALGYHLRKALNREAWYITSREAGTIYVLLHNGSQWQVNEAFGDADERKQLEREVRDAVFLGEQAGGEDE